MIDFNTILGASLIRGKNRAAKKTSFANNLTLPHCKMLNFTTLPIESITFNLELVLRVQTNLKLNLFCQDGPSRVHHLDLSTTDSFTQEEVHFMRVEGVYYEEIQGKSVDESATDAGRTLHDR